MTQEDPAKSIAVVDLGGQYCHLIARRLRDLRVRARIFSPDVAADAFRGYAGIILSGGPSSVYDADAPSVDRRVVELGTPLLGICYGHQLLAKYLGAAVNPGEREYGLSRLSIVEPDSLFRGTPGSQQVWMSHSDTVSGLPPGLMHLARTDRCEVAAFGDPVRKLFGVQFHPEVTHSQHGTEILRNFVLDVCRVEPDAGAASRLADLEEEIRTRVGGRSVFFLVSGGVDSSVAFALCARALPPGRILGLYVDTGLMRKGEAAELRESFARLGLQDRLRVRDESARFLAALAGVVEPETKRQIIGRLFVEVQAEALQELGVEEGGWLLGQGTIYPDTIESGGSAGRAAVIKTHHNRCAEILALIEKGQVIEPLSQFYKDEVREIGRALGLDPGLTNRWPFPGPGLAIRLLCNDLDEPRAAQRIEIGAGRGGYEAWHLPLRSVGVQGDGRTYREVVALRGPIDYPRLQEISSETCNASALYNRVIAQLAGNGESGDLANMRVGPAQVTAKRLETLREADFIARSSMREAGLADAVWQFPVILLPAGFGGGESVVLRPVNSTDGMTANFARLPLDLLDKMAGAICSLPGVDAVFLDCTDKPPATIEWE
ncbi:MAG TPA: glutamine-hydrolyzing GMP synthase [Thermoanaerobaculia bacterium]|nr:glutamine-hydrolyzing GMP synthase [Thermoanaerobaculia bacterium]